LNQRFDVDLRQVTATGHSVGASVIWELACHRSSDYAALVAFSGTLWEPVPTSCPGPPVPLLHAHGLADQVFPMEGRALGGAVQGAVRPLWEVATERAGCAASAPAAPWRGMSCVDQVGCDAPHRFCTWEGEHKLQNGWYNAALEWIISDSLQ
jgi:polyhydroxybutyrate depolymerase